MGIDLRFYGSELILVYSGPKLSKAELNRNIERIRKWFVEKKYWSAVKVDNTRISIEFNEEWRITVDDALTELSHNLEICTLFDFHTQTNITYSVDWGNYERGVIHIDTKSRLIKIQGYHDAEHLDQQERIITW